MAPHKPRVLLLHGLWMHAPAMRWFATRLGSHGFGVRALGYYSVLEDTDRAVSRVADALHDAPGSHVVAHSLGGLMALEAARRLTTQDIGRVVCLGSPLAGSRAAGGVAERIPAGRRMLGQHLPLLLAGAGTLPAGLEVGMIAGCKPRGLGGVVARFDCEHDGTVALSETRIDGLADHIVLPASHSGLIFSDAAVAQSVAFLQAGRFRHGDDGRGAGIA
ncbi:esterase/lipase family protein [Solilutibacter oculi]|nr:alpha/beta hydrolase [Lysobacter oculi]